MWEVLLIVKIFFHKFVVKYTFPASNMQKEAVMSRQTDEQQKNINMEKLIDLYGDELLRLCYLYLHDLQLAEDAVQEAYIRIFRGYEKFQGKSKEKTWITRIAINVCKSYLRSSWKQKVFYGDIETVQDEKQIAQEMEIKDDTVIRAIYQLKPKYKEVILLFYYQEFKVAEIAQILDISASAVTVRLTRAREQLKDRLEGWYFDE